MSLAPEDFAAFFDQVYGHRPFPWQSDLVARVVHEGSWPALVDVPTGLGKTAMIDIAVFLTAMTADRHDANRLGRRRIFFVVDRRIVVDQAHERATYLSRALEQAPSGVVREVSERLGLLGDGTDVLPVVRMRGGVTWDAAWLTRPDLPGIVTGTVDQVGSRLFFRGYGVSSGRWPIDAALVGADSLILVDEAHLATAMTTTLDAAQHHDPSAESLGLPSPAVVQLTATASGRTGAGWVYNIDVEAHLDADPEVAGRRLRATKSLSLMTSSKTTIVKNMASRAAALAEGDAARVLVVCNTIDRARAVHTELDSRLPDRTHRSLLIGRSRTIDREQVVDEALARFEATDQGRAAGSSVLVATQTVEVGADLDATALVTESASWDALVQRIGRVNRRGQLTGSAPVEVVHDGETKGSVYGDSRLVTWGFLVEQLKGVSEDGLDVSPLGCRRLFETVPHAAYQPAPVTPLLLPAHLDAWARTAPAPTNDAPLDAYLHGLDNGVAPVSLAWRDGLGAGPSLGSAQTTTLIDVIPVRSSETVEVPISAVRRWLSDERTVQLSEFDDDEDDDIAFGGDETEYQVVRRAQEADGVSSWLWARASDLRPGDQVVVPSHRGGLDAYGWAPASHQRVRDIAEIAALDAGRAVLRLDDELPDRLALEAPAASLWDDVRSLTEQDDPDRSAELAVLVGDRIRRWLADSETVKPGPWDRKGRRETLRASLQGSAPQESIASGPRRRPSDEVVSSVVVMRSPTTGNVRWQEARDDTADGTAHTDARVTLDDHQRHVGERADDIASYLGLPKELRRVVVDAARWHDLGKVDPRFQAMLFGGDAMRATLADEPLAKSGMPPGDLQQHRDAKRLSGLPYRARHEAWSAALVETHLERLSPPYDGDTDLLLHLVASHHGHARPLLPPVPDEAAHDLVALVDGYEVTAPLPRRVDVDLAVRFAALNRRYGRWGLALLESVVRCADMTVSGEGR